MLAALATTQQPPGASGYGFDVWIHAHVHVHVHVHVRADAMQPSAGAWCTLLVVCNKGVGAGAGAGDRTGTGAGGLYKVAGPGRAWVWVRCQDSKAVLVCGTWRSRRSTGRRDEGGRQAGKAMELRGHCGKVIIRADVSKRPRETPPFDGWKRSRDEAHATTRLL